MTRDEFVTYIRQAGTTGLFAPQELNEVLLLVYNIVGWAVRDGADTLTVEPTVFRWSRAGEPLGAWRTDTLPTTVRYRDELARILERDTTVQRYVHLVDASDGMETFHLGDNTAAVPRPA